MKLIVEDGPLAIEQDVDPNLPVSQLVGRGKKQHVLDANGSMLALDEPIRCYVHLVPVEGVSATVRLVDDTSE